MNIPALAFSVLVRLALDAGANPHDWALVLYEESGFDPSTPNRHGYQYFGLNQMGESEARSVGYRGDFPAGWLALSAAEQLPYVAAYFVQKRRACGPVAFASAAHLLACNWLPGIVQQLGHTDPADIDYPLCRAGDPYYGANAVYDPDRKGYITIRDLALYLERKRRHNPNDMIALLDGVNGAIAEYGIDYPPAPSDPGGVAANVPPASPFPYVPPPPAPAASGGRGWIGALVLGGVVGGVALYLNASHS